MTKKRKKKMHSHSWHGEIQVSGLINLWFLRVLFMAYKCVFWLKGPEFHKSILKCYCQFYPLNLQDFFSLCLTWKINRSRNYLKVWGRGSWLVADFILFWWREGMMVVILTFYYWNYQTYWSWTDFTENTRTHCPDPTVIVSLYLLYHISVQLSTPPFVNSGYFF